MQQVKIIADEETIRRVEPVLEALGFQVIATTPSPLAATSKARRKLARLLGSGKLTERLAETVELYAIDGLPTDVVAERLQISRATVKWHLTAARARIGGLPQRAGSLVRYMFDLPLYTENTPS